MNEQSDLFMGECPRCGYPNAVPKKRTWTASQRTKTLREARALAAAGVPLHWLARWDDPETSGWAAFKDTPRRLSLRLKLLYAMMVLGRASVRRACKSVGIDHDRSGAWKRFSELKQMGLVRATGMVVPGEGALAEVYESLVRS